MARPRCFQWEKTQGKSVRKCTQKMPFFKCRIRNFENIEKKVEAYDSVNAVVAFLSVSIICLGKSDLLVVWMSFWVQDYTWDERVEWLHQKKLKGGRLFKKKLYKEALEAYFDVLKGLDINNKEAEKREVMMNEFQIPTVLNISSCMYVQGQPDSAMKLINNAISLNPKRSDSYRKRAHLQKALKKWNSAK